MLLTFGWLYRRLGIHYFKLLFAFDLLSAFTICLAAIGLFTLYVDPPAGAVRDSVLFAEAWVAFALLHGWGTARRMAAPMLDWVRSGRGSDGALEAWRTAVSLPRDFLMRNVWQPFAIVIPVAIYVTYRFHLPAPSVVIVMAGAVPAVAYSAILHFFVAEMFLRPVITEAGERVPGDLRAERTGMPVRWKLLGALPLINVITGVVVSGLSTDSRASLEDLGLDVVVAIVVAFTISFELTLLVTKSVLRPVNDLLKATERVKGGDLDVRVPIVSADELGELGVSFNEMVQGLSEREVLRQAFGSYVDPDVAERVLEEGELLEGRDVEVTVLFVDIRDFTAFSERSSARELVVYLNEFFELVVPLLSRHGGHANKFVGDGLLGVFGAPQRLPDHADRGLAAACDIAAAVEQRFGGSVEIGIGVNSGPVVVGSVGGGGRLEFTVIGDPVNVAARVEQATRETGDRVLLTEATRCLLERSRVELEPRGEVALKGKTNPVPIFSPVEQTAVTMDSAGRLATGA